MCGHGDPSSDLHPQLERFLLNFSVGRYHDIDQEGGSMRLHSMKYRWRMTSPGKNGIVKTSKG
jgi:hypothetical protein